MADKIRARKSRYGFTLNTQTGEAEAYDKALEALSISSNHGLKKDNKRFLQELLFEMVDSRWNGEDYILGYKPKTQETFDIGFNIFVGEKWPTKAWNKEKWDVLEKMLKEKGLSVTRQDQQSEEILNNLHSYIDWINSAKIIVTADTLGLHLAFALKKKVLGLFGPISANEIHFYGQGKAILPEPAPHCLPCFSRTCERGRNCMEDISPETIYKEINSLLN